MPVDIAAEVMANRALSAQYNVITLAAPAIAAGASPGQFVMLKAAGGCDPLLRRPFSIFEVFRDREGNATAVSILSKRIGTATRLLYDARPGDRVARRRSTAGTIRPVSPAVPSSVASTMSTPSAVKNSR